jgi:hypothetical protein
MPLSIANTCFSFYNERKQMKAEGLTPFFPSFRLGVVMKGRFNRPRRVWRRPESLEAGGSVLEQHPQLETFI